MRSPSSALALLWIVGCEGSGGATSDAAVAVDVFVPADVAVVAAPERCGRTYCERALPSTGAMVAIGDGDGDGHLDVLLGDVGRDVRRLGTVVFLHGRGDGSFEDRTVATGLAGYGAWAAHFADLDNDGDADLVMGGRPPARRGEETERGAVMVLDNDGHGHFTDRSAGRVPADDGAGVPLALDVADLDQDGRLDLVIGRAGRLREGEYAPSVLMANAGGGYRLLTGLPQDPGFSWVVLATDFDADGRPDLLAPRDAFATHQVAERPTDSMPCDEDTGMSHAVTNWINSAYRQGAPAGAPAFARASLNPGYETPLLSPMGVGAGDLDRDGLTDYLFTNAGSPLLLVARAGGGFDDRTDAAGLTLTIQPGPGGGSSKEAIPVSWSALARDLDRDGRLDLLMTFGVIPVTLPGAANTVYLQGSPMRFAAERDTGFELPGSWSSLATGDFDEDGDEDLIMGSQTILLRGCDRPGPARYLRNDRALAGRHWLRVRLVGTVSNRDGLGARVTASLPDGARLVREVSRAGGVMSSSDATVDLGLGDAATLPSLEVRWPSGRTQRLTALSVDRTLVLTEAAP
jgi:hypothetical protein